MKSEEIRKRFLEFFKKRDHAVIPSASLVPENDPSVLFTTAGMHPLAPYLLGQKHPLGNKLASAQKCLRTQDIDSVGDKNHGTFFEMLGNWSLGDYFKEEAIKWSYELLTSKEEGFGLVPNRLYITCFAGDQNAPRDEESARIWQSLGISAERIYFLPAKNNWWSPGDNGPAGPDTEIFYDVTEKGLGEMNKEEFLAADERQEVMEFWNDVFMEYEKKNGRVTGRLSQKNVDTGMGLERLAMILQKKESIYETDLFLRIMEKIRSLSNKKDIRAERIIADHIRAAVFIMADGVRASNTDRGYVLRRLLRRAIRYGDILKIKEESLFLIAEEVINQYSNIYKNLGEEREIIKEELNDEEKIFRLTLNRGMKEFEKMAGSDISGEQAFILFSTFGFPLELTVEMAKEKGIQVDEAGYAEEMNKHREISKTSAEGKFKGGLAGHSEMEIKYHTATHLLHQALRYALGTHVKQEGSNITTERLRFDFTHPAKMTDEEKACVEQIMNEKIESDLPVRMVTLPRAEAEAADALHFFKEKYGDTVNVYYIGDSLENAYSKEFCGGPHVSRTGELGHFRIIKEEAVASGIRRIKAALE